MPRLSWEEIEDRDREYQSRRSQMDGKFITNFRPSVSYPKAVGDTVIDEKGRVGVITKILEDKAMRTYIHVCIGTEIAIYPISDIYKWKVFSLGDKVIDEQGRIGIIDWMSKKTHQVHVELINNDENYYMYKR